MKCVVLALLFFATAAVAQPRVEFDAASVKPHATLETRSRVSGLTTSPLTGDVLAVLEHISLTNIELRRVIQLAYGISGSQRFALVGGREDMLSSRYDVVATVPKGTTGNEAMRMLRALLDDRFALRIHKETRELPAYVVTVARPARLGPELYPSEIDCTTYRRPDQPDHPEPLARDGQLLCRRSDKLGPPMTSVSAGRITNLLSRFQGFFDRPLIDATGLTGTFEWKLSFDFRSDSPNPAGPFIRDAFEDQLGLKTEPRNAPVDVWVIDSVEAATPD